MSQELHSGLCMWLQVPRNLGYFLLFSHVHWRATGSEVEHLELAPVPTEMLHVAAYSEVLQCQSQIILLAATIIDCWEVGITTSGFQMSPA